MKLTPRFTILLLACAAAAIVLIRWSARIGREVWAPKVFGWRNWLKPKPNVEQPPDCPLRLLRPRFYSFMSLGSSIGSTIRFDAKNVGDKSVHSFKISFLSPNFLDTSEIGITPQAPLEPDQSTSVGWSSRGRQRVTIRVILVQFVDGDVWNNNHL